MDCTKAREVMWEEKLPEDFFAHIETCPECKKAYELVCKTKSELSKTDDMTHAIMCEIKKKERTRKISLITKVAAVFIAVLAVGIFAKIIIDNGLEKSDKGLSNERDMSIQQEETYSNETNGSYGYGDDGMANDEDHLEQELPMKPEFAEPEAPTEAPSESIPMEPEYAEPEAPMEPPSESIESEYVTQDSATTESEVEEEKYDHGESDFNEEADTILKAYKEANSFASHTADIVVSGDNIAYALETLSEFSPVDCNSHIEIDGDFYFETQKALDRAGFEILLTTSSETIGKTVVYFESLMQ